MLALLLCPPVLLSLASLLPHCYKTAAVFQSNIASFKMRNRRSRKVYLHGCLSLFFRRGAEGGTHRLRPITPQAPLGRACFAGDQAIVLPKHKSRLCSRSKGPAAGQAVVRPAGVSENGSVCEQTAIKGEKSPPRFCFL